MGEGGFWDHQESAKTVVSEVKILKTQIEPVQDLLQRIEDVHMILLHILFSALLERAKSESAAS